MAHTRYSPEPVEAYKHASMFKFFAVDEATWNLAYLSWDFEAKRDMPDPHLSVHCLRTLQFVVETGEIDLTDSLPEKCKVRGLMSCPAPQAVHRLTNLSRVKELPLFRAYGQKWLDTMVARSRLYREPDDAEFDFEIKNVAQALDVIQTCWR